ncbi:MAG TPA: helix-turn-helix domain-containing protein [Clostridia bacterium]
MSLSNAVKLKLKQKGMTVKDLAMVMDIPYTTLASMFSRGLEKVDVNKFIDICVAMDEKPEEIIKLAYKDASKPTADAIKEMENALERLGLPKDTLDKMSEEDLKAFLDMARRYLISRS